MKKAELIYVEVLNETEQLFLFAVEFNKKLYGLELALNLALPVTIQDIQIRRLIAKVETMKRADAKDAT